jgi:hypothetical protein
VQWLYVLSLVVRRRLGANHSIAKDMRLKATRRNFRSTEHSKVGPSRVSSNRCRMLSLPSQSRMHAAGKTEKRSFTVKVFYASRSTDQGSDDGKKRSIVWHDSHFNGISGVALCAQHTTASAMSLDRTRKIHV